jgi:hypothetical protein
MNTFSHLLVTVLAVAAMLAPASSLLAQSGKPPRDPAAIQRKVQRSADLQRQALEALSEPAKAARHARGAYVELKSALDDMVMNSSNSKYPDPMLDLSSRKAERALALVQVAGDALNAHDRWSDPDAEVAGVRSRLQQSLQITNTLLATGF